MTSSNPLHADGPIIQTRALTRVFRGTNAVDNINLDVRRGQVYGLLGPNGAGKSTTLKMLLGLLPPTSGEVELFGHRWSRESLGRIGASVEGPSIYGHLSAAQNLQVHVRLLGLSRSHVGPVLSRVGLGESGKKKARAFSTGMKGRLALGIALLGDPELLILDEPQNGLDAEGITALRTMMTDFTATGRTIVLSSHLLHEVAQVADTVGVIVHGRLNYQGSLKSLAPDGDLERAYFKLTEAALV